MNQYVLQVITEIGRLIKSYKVTLEHPIRLIIPEGRQQIIITDVEKFSYAVAFYEEYKPDCIFTIADDDITWELRV